VVVAYFSTIPRYTMPGYARAIRIYREYVMIEPPADAEAQGKL
jgi:hypothetical protein